jgi:hypothetical protein
MTGEVERRNLNTRPKKGDIVEATWLDHYEFRADKPATKPVGVKSWGKLAWECEAGVAIAQTEVIDEDQFEHPVPNIATGQFVVRGAMIAIRRVEAGSETESVPEIDVADAAKL